MPYVRTKGKLTVTVDQTLIDAIETIRDNTKYANRSSVTNFILKEGLEAQGIKLEV